MDFFQPIVDNPNATTETLTKLNMRWNLGISKWANAEEIAKIYKPKVFWKGKTIKQWQELTGGDKGQIQKHIANGTMETYRAYLKYIGKEDEWVPAAQRHVKRLFQGKSIRQWQELTGGNTGEIRKHIANGTMEKYKPYLKYIGKEHLWRKTAK